MARVRTFKSLFAQSFKKEKSNQDHLSSQVLKYAKAIDKLISSNAPAWPIEQIAPVDLTILRLAIFELIFQEKKEPYKVVIDEAVEIAKEYGSESSSAFVNGVLGSIVKSKIK